MNIIIENWEIIAGICSFIIAYLGGRKIKSIEVKKANEEVKTSELNNISSNFKVYQDLINDLETRFKSRIIDLEDDLNRMKVITSDMRSVITDQENYIKKLKLRLLKYENLDGGKY